MEETSVATGTVIDVTDRWCYIKSPRLVASGCYPHHGINKVPEQFRKEGLKVNLEYRVTNAWGLWFVTGEAA